MCGICGELRFDGRWAAVERVQAMTRTMTRRGPDGSGLFAHERLALGHCRLKIIDLSERAQQPMVDPALGLSIAFNGMIYNYPELRKELAVKGYRFFSHSDTEVILKAYHAWGERFVERLIGMFAFALWERDSGRVLFGRDRLGIKPFYYAETPGAIRFASALPALLAAGDIDTDIDPVALHHYMTFHAVVPAPETILRGVRKLPPATVMVFEPDGRRREFVYWEPHFDPHDEEQDVTFEEWQERITEALDVAIMRRMIADVPVGVLLSGGLDSSLVVGLLARHGQKGLKTFSIGFEAVGKEKGDEFEYSDVIVEHFQTDHTKIHVDSRRTLPSLKDCVRAMSEPMVSHDAIGFFLLSQEVAKHVKVVQSGQGADEVFGGYHWYPPLLLESDDPVKDYARVFFDRDHEEYSKIVHPRFVQEDYSRGFVAEHFARPGATRAIDKAMRLDTQVMLVDDPVKRVDNMTMASGLEARVPFLDHELVELAARIPAEMKVARGGKLVLKELSRKVIPHEVIDRPKGYFPVPALKYIRGEYHDFVREVMHQPAARQRELFQQEYVERLLEQPDEHITPLRGSKLWQVTLLEYWLQVHGL